MGGADKVKRQHDRGKMDARTWLDTLVDAYGFREISKIACTGADLYMRTFPFSATE
ncbi:MAG: hypothetical protein AAGH53_03215 [Pseudomonadota bacterium]